MIQPKVLGPAVPTEEEMAAITAALTMVIAAQAEGSVDDRSLNQSDRATSWRFADRWW